MESVHSDGQIPSDKGKTISVLLIGNNPMELGSLYDTLRYHSGVRFLTETAFNVKDSLMKVIKFKPHCIIIDDNIGKKAVARLVEEVNSDEATSHISIALIKNSNYMAVASSGIQDFLLKTEASAERLHKLVTNSIYLKQTRSYLFASYKKNKGRLMRLLVRLKKGL